MPKITYHGSFWLILLLPFSFVLPWAVHSSSILTLGGYDLAEWLSLHPQVQLDRLLPLMLRGHLVLIAWLIQLQTGDRLTLRWWLSELMVGLLLLAQLPPLEFFANFGQDANQVQQFSLVAISAVGIGGLLIIKQSIYGWISAILAFVGSISSLITMNQYPALMIPYHLEIQVGIGAFLMAIVYGLIVIWNGRVIYTLNKTG